MSSNAIRESLEELSPPWLRGDVGVRLIYDIGLQCDRLCEKAFQGAMARLPGLGTPTALPALGAARLIPRGPSETDTEYPNRLRKSWDSWGFAGSNRGVLSIALGCLLDNRPDALAVSQDPSGTMAVWDEYLSGDNFDDPSLVGAPSHFVGLDWDWDADVVGAWWRIFIVVFSVSPNANWTAPLKWGSGGTWGDGRAWGCQESNAQGTTVNAALKNWRAGQT